MSTEKLLNILTNSNIVGTEYEDKFMRILRFLYHDVIGNETAKIKKLYDRIALVSELKDRYAMRIESIEHLKKNLLSFIDSSNDGLSILDNFEKMFADENYKIFFDKVYSEFDIMFKLIDNSAYNKDDFNINGLVFNLYVIMNLYDRYKDNFDRFSQMVDMYFFPIELNESNYFKNYILNKECIDKIIKSEYFDELPDLQMLAKKILMQMDNNFSNVYSNNINALISVVVKICSDTKELDVEKYESVDTSKILERMFGLFNNSNMYNYNESKFLDEIIYGKVFLVNDRYNYLLNLIKGNNNDYKKDILSRTSNYLSFGLFDYLNEHDEMGKDSFKKCMDIVFDSDTYFEFDSKIKALVNASKNFDFGRIAEASEIIKDLDSVKHKQKLNENIVMYQVENQNKIIKPNSILERMYDLYSLIDPDMVKKDIFPNRMDTIDDFNYLLNKNIEEYQKKLLKNVVESSNEDVSVSEEKQSNDGDENKTRKIKFLNLKRNSK